VSREQALLILLPVAFYLVPFTSTLVTRGPRSLAALSVLWLGVTAFFARPILDHPPGPRCGLGEMIALIFAMLVAVGFSAGFAGKVLLLRRPNMELPRAATIVAALGLAGFAGVAGLFRRFFGL
jgi:hypothetical protein